jgi:hypothetical protein
MPILENGSVISIEPYCYGEIAMAKSGENAQGAQGRIFSGINPGRPAIRDQARGKLAQK